jgi:hypothetical protein
MIDNSLIQDAFAPLIGFRRGYDADNADIDADLTISEGGTFVDGLHPLLSSANLEATMQENTAFVVPRGHDTTVTYNKWDIVEKSNALYYSLKDDNTDNDPFEVDSIYWKQTNLFSHYLRTKRNASITNLLNAVKSSGKDVGNKEVLQNTLLYYGSGRHIKEKNSRFVGFMLTLQKQDLTVRVPRIILEFTTAQTIPLKVYHSTLEDAVAAYDLEYTNAGKQQSFLLPTELLLKFNNNDIGGFYTIGYYEDDLSVDNFAIYSDNLPFDGTNCNSCSNRNAQAYALYSPYVDVQAIQVDSDFITDKPLQTWNETDIVITGAQSWGLNLSFTVVCDLTAAYIYNKDLFVAALGSQMKLDFLTIIAHNSRNKGLSDMIRSQAFAELKSEQSPYQELSNAVKNITLDMSGLNPICLPCVEKKAAFKWGSVWNTR